MGFNLGFKGLNSVLKNVLLYVCSIIFCSHCTITKIIIECLDLFRELLMAQPTISWPITPVKKQSPSKCHVLIEQELSEDSSDEEYQPNDEEQEQVFEPRSLKNGTGFCSEVLCYFDL